MNTSQKRTISWFIVAAVIVAIQVFLGVSYPVPPPPVDVFPEGVALGTTHFTNLETEDLIVDDTFNIDETASVIVGTQTLTPTATYYQMSPATTLTVTLATGSASDGDLLILQSLVATDTVIVDTTCTVGGAAITLGSAGDMAVFIFGNSLWCEIASPDNS